MAYDSSVDATGLRAYLARDWKAVRDLKEDGWIEQLEAGDPAEGIRLAAELYEDAKAARPDWPTDEDRSDDFRHHVQLAELLRRAALPGR